MGRRIISLLNVVITLSLAFAGTLSGILIPSPVTTGTAHLPVVAPGTTPPGEASPRLKRPRTHNRTKQNRQQQRKLKDRKSDRKQEKKKDRSGSKAGRNKSAEDRYIVILEPSARSPERAASAVASESTDVTVTQVYDHVIDGFAAIIPDDQLDEVRNDPQVKAVVPDQEVRAFEQSLPTGINRINADKNPTANFDGRDERVDVDVAVLDTGIGPHPDLNVVDGVSCIDGITSYADDNGHGTHIAGTIGALDNSIGVVGVAPGARLWSVKVLHSDKRGRWSEIICGLDWVAANSGTIDVVNMSLGAPGSDSSCSGEDALHDAICRVVDAGVPVVVAAGNSSSDAASTIPAAYDQVITVSALADSDGKPFGAGSATSDGRDDSLALFSNFGADVDIAAPGVNVLSTVMGGYARGSGTSVAAPHVAGAAALYLAENPGATPAEVKAALHSAREAIVLPNDRDGINEGVLYAGDGNAPTAPKHKKQRGKRKR
jgi:subtilisin